MEDKDFYWLVGLLEGEGSFGLSDGDYYPVVQIAMTDVDIVERAAGLLGCNLNGPYKSKVEHHKQSWKCSLNGKRAVEWMRKLLPFMGERRQQRIKDVLTLWDNKPDFSTHNRGYVGRVHKKEKSIPTCEHKNKPVVGYGVCQTCYMRKWRMDRKNISQSGGIFTMA